MKVISTGVAVLVLSGCALTPQQASQMSSFEICDKMGSPMQPAKGVAVGINELSKRGENCSQFAEIFNERSNRQTVNSANSAALVGAGAYMLNQSRPSTVVQPVIVQQEVVAPAPAPRFPRIGQ
ncbi:hypothetical protein D3C86_1241380 [compost metagenome]